MIGVVLLAQAAQSGGVAGQTSVDAAERALADFTSVLEAGRTVTYLGCPCVR